MVTSAQASYSWSLKVDILKSKLEKELRQVARTRGVEAIRMDGKKLGISLGVGVVGLFLGGAMGGDKHSMLNGGLRTFDASLQGFGEAEWAVSLDRKMLIMPRE